MSTSNNTLEILNGRGKNLPTDRFAYKTNLDGSGQFALDALISDLKDSEIDESRMSVMIPYADGRRRDGVGDLLEIGGIDLSRHRYNAVALLDHGKQHSLPLGMCLERDGTKYDSSKFTVVLDPVAQVARANIFFYQGKGFQAGNSYGSEAKKVPLSKGEEFEHALLCEQCFDMLVKGLIRGGSIGYQVKRAEPLMPDYERGTPQGLHLLETLQLEVSIVVLPANQDTVRKALSDNRCCGQPLATPLVKSLTPHASPRKAQLGYEGKSIRVPLDDNLSKTKIPPVRWRPGEGAVKSEGEGTEAPSPHTVSNITRPHPTRPHRTLPNPTTGSEVGTPILGKNKNSEIGKPGLGALKELRRKYRKAHHLATSYAMSGGESHGTHEFREGGTAHTRRALTFTDPSGRVGNFARSGERVKIISLHPDGSCLIENEAGQVKHDFTSNLRKSLEGTKALPSLRQKYRRPAKSFRWVLRKSRPGSALVYVRGKDLEKCRCQAEGRGLKFAHLGRHGTGLEKVKVSGDDKHIDAVAREWGQPVKAVRGIKSMGTKAVNHLGEQEFNNYNAWIRAIKAKYPGAKIEGDKEIANALVDGRGIGEWDGEKGVIYKKSLQGANGMKTKDYEGMAGGDERDIGGEAEKDLGGQEPYGAQARRRVHQDLSILMQEYDQIRQLCEHEQVNAHLEELLQHFAEHLERIESEWEGDEVHKDLPPLEGSMSEDKDLPEEGEEEPGEQEGETEEEPNEPEEEAEEAGSGEGEGEEAMKGLYGNVKELRKGIRKTTGPKGPKTTRHDVAAGQAQGGEPRGVGQSAQWRSNNRSTNPKASGKPGGGNIHKGVKPGYEEYQDRPGYTATGEEIPGEPGYEEHQDKPGEPGSEEDIKLLPHHHHHVGEAHGFLGEVSSMDDGTWGEEHRMKSYHFHKSLENVADELEGTGGDHVPGHEEDQDKPGQEGTEDYFEGKGIRKTTGPKGPKQPKKPENRVRGMTSKVVKPEQAWHEDKPKNPKGKDLTEDELHQLEGDMDGAMEDTEEDKHPHVKALRNASGCFKELSGVQQLTPDHQIKAMACQKDLNPMLNEVEDEMGTPKGKEEVDVEVGGMGEKADANSISTTGRTSHEQGSKLRTPKARGGQGFVSQSKKPNSGSGATSQTPYPGSDSRISKDLTEEEVKSLQELKDQNDSQAKQMKNLSSTIVQLARLTN